MSDFNGNNNVPSDPTMPTIDNPEFEVPPQPAQFQQPEFQSINNQQQGFQQNDYQQPVFVQNNIPPKKSKKKLVGIISAIAGVAIIGGVAVFAGPKIIDALSGASKEAPIDRLKNSITASSKEFSDSVLNNKDNVAMNQQMSFNGNMKLNVKLGDYIVSMIPEQYAGLKDTTIDLDLAHVDKQLYFDMDVATPIDTAATLKGYMDTKDMNIFLQVPQLSNSFISSTVNVTGFDVSTPTVPNLSNEEFAALIDDETKTFLDSIKEVKLEEDVTVEVSGIEAKYDKLSVAMNGSEFSDTVYKCYERLSQESFLQECFNLYATESGTSVSDTLDDLKDWANRNSKGVTLDFYMDDDKIKGLVMIPESEDTKKEIGFLTATNQKTGFNFFAKDNNENLFTMDGSYTDSKNVYSGNVKFSNYEDGIVKSTFEVKFNDVKCDAKDITGTFVITTSELNGFTITVDTNFHDKSGTLGVNVAMASMDMATVTLDYNVKDADSCPTLPADAVIYDLDTQMEDYLYTADLPGFITSIKNATGIDITSLIQNGIN